eukprot:TRINITY_DN2189_c0_g2_i1.p1 TRINITY_DN2189_c0_g2~~TRINITY_DN2189_c0_g2_i1.p1  ORF type:complete len:757 (-),score=148.47 TRINITY_DN2189_c0_g2_i1:227-2497(-)
MWGWLVSLVEKPLDYFLVLADESVKATIQEIGKLLTQLATTITALFLGLFYKQGYLSYKERKSRIRTQRENDNLNEKDKPIVSEDETKDNPIHKRVKFMKDKRKTPFADLLNDETEGWTLDGEKFEENIPFFSPPVSRDRPQRANRLTERRFSTPYLSSVSPYSHDRSNLQVGNKQSLPAEIDLVHHHEQLATGLFEDLMTNTMVLVDRTAKRLREFIHSFLESITFLSILTALPKMIGRSLKKVIHPHKTLQWFEKAFQWIRSLPSKIKNDKLISPHQLDIRSVHEIISQAGYPYQNHTVTTDDGYILSLERIPNPGSKDVVYFQHGIFDNSFAWVANGSTGSLAFRAWEQGYDVWLGNFRGNGEKKHVKPDLSPKEYWNFSINEHAFKDIPAFVKHIYETKHRELKITQNNEKIETNENEIKEDSDDDSLSKDIRISAVSHSMGAAATLMYIVYSRMNGGDHRLQQAILLSPAGYHYKAPYICDVLGPVINLYIRLVPSFYVFRFPSESIRVLTAKTMHSLIHNPVTKDLVVYLISNLLLGGEPSIHPVARIPNLAYNTFSGTSVKIYKHFWQLYKRGRFEGYDYGSEKENMEKYGTKTPPDFMEHYDLIDIPIYFVMGLRDNLIAPQNIMKHHKQWYQRRVRGNTNIQLLSLSLQQQQQANMLPLRTTLSSCKAFIPKTTLVFTPQRFFSVGSNIKSSSITLTDIRGRDHTLDEILKGKRVVLFGIPGRTTTDTFHHVFSSISILFVSIRKSY